MQIALPENHEHIHWFASIPKVAIMHARLLRSSAKNRLKSSAVRKTRKAIFESLEHKHLMAIDSIIGVDPSRTLDLPPDYSPTESANLRSNATDARNRATRLADSFIPGSGDPNAPYSSQLMQVGDAAKQSGTLDVGLANQAAWQDWSNAIRANGSDSTEGTSLLALTAPVRQLSSAWSSQKDTDSVDLFRESPVSNRSRSIDDAGGFDPSKGSSPLILPLAAVPFRSRRAVLHI
jgi:hypothetical protein